jgi:chitobiase/beta-hexosaminidase-like protein
MRRVAILILACLPLCGQSIFFNSNYNAGGGGGGTVTAATDSPGGGTYSSAQSISFSGGTAGATTCYTTDGSTPAASTPGTCSAGSTYSSSFTSPSSTFTLKWIGTKSAMTNSGVQSSVYTTTVSDTDVITTFTHSGTVQTYSNCLGWSFNAISSFTMTKLWREKLSGDTGTKTVALVNDSNTTIDSCTIDTSTGSVGDRQTCSLSSPRSFTGTETAWKIMQMPTAGASYQYFNLSALNTTSVVTKGSATGATYSSGTTCTSYNGYDVAANSAGPVGFLYH